MSFVNRHVGLTEADVAKMLEVVGSASVDALIDETVPRSLRLDRPLDLPATLPESEMLATLKAIAENNVVSRSYIGAGYFPCITPAVIRRSILENPGWYTQYTPYQAEISQGRLEALVNFQTMVCDMTAMDLANASLLDEGTAAAEAMALCLRKAKKQEKYRFLVANNLYPQTVDVVRTRAEPLGIEIESLDPANYASTDLTNCFAVLLQYPTNDGSICDYSKLTAAFHDAGMQVVVAADLLSLCLLTPPGEWGADIVVGSAQRFGVPPGFGGPHAAFFGVKKAYQRDIPGRLVGVSKDADGDTAYRLALQTREQHIRRERATSNICTAQVLLAVIASMYAVWHGPNGLRDIAKRVARLTGVLAAELRKRGVNVTSGSFFDTIRVSGAVEEMDRLIAVSQTHSINLRRFDKQSIAISFDETVDARHVSQLISVFCEEAPSVAEIENSAEEIDLYQQLAGLVRASEFLSHPVFNSYHSETEFVRYVERLRRKDLSLVDGMIPLGSCTMKLNAAAEMEPITWPELASLHPFVPEEQARGYERVISDLEYFLAETTGMAAVSLQPNAGSQGEYAGLLAIRGYHHRRGERGRNICLIPQSAHGTNPASAAMAGMKVVVVPCDDDGNVDVEALREAAQRHRAELAAMMITYPSTHGVFESQVAEMCEIIHSNGGLVYMDGANMNAMVGLCRPGDFGVDVCHLNLHKTFSIPHGGGGPGVGPIAVNDKLAPFLPGHSTFDDEDSAKAGSVSSAPWGSAGVLAIPWAYIRMMGSEGLKQATELAILNANYVAERLEEHFPVLYRGENRRVAHECILDCRGFKRSAGIEVMDIAKRLMDYGFHAPTVSFPVPGTLMVEPTESESKAELDRFCDAMIAIRKEIAEIEEGRADAENNVLKNAPHTMKLAASDEWSFPYTREQAVYPMPELKESKFWPSVRRIEDAYGDRNLFCACVPIGEEKGGG